MKPKDNRPQRVYPDGRGNFVVATSEAEAEKQIEDLRFREAFGIPMPGPRIENVLVERDGDLGTSDVIFD